MFMKKNRPHILLLVPIMVEPWENGGEKPKQHFPRNHEVGPYQL